MGLRVAKTRGIPLEHILVFYCHFRSSYVDFWPFFQFLLLFYRIFWPFCPLLGEFSVVPPSERARVKCCGWGCEGGQGGVFLKFRFVQPLTLEMFLCGGCWWVWVMVCKPMLVFSLSLCQAEQYSPKTYLKSKWNMLINFQLCVVFYKHNFLTRNC